MHPSKLGASREWLAPDQLEIANQSIVNTKARSNSIGRPPMSKKPNREPDDPEQSKRFIETAREMRADETRAGTDRAFKKAVLPKQQARKQT
jgi:hypothetical protein